LTVVLALVLTGVPQMAQAQAAAPPQQAPAQTPQAPPRPGLVDPSQGPLQPVAPSQTLPNAPSVSAPQEQTSSEPTARTSGEPQRPAESQRPTEPPAGAAVGQQGATAGGAASKPAGNAIAPAKQRQVRSLLIKLGLIGAAGVAVGTVVGLSKSSPSKPPNSR
jgi:hypothetical protein